MLPDLGPALLVLAALAVVGLIALALGVPYAVYWLIENFDIVRVK